MITVPDIWSALPTLSTLAPVSQMFSLASALIDGKVLMLFLMEKIQIQGIVYTGIIMAMMMAFVSSAYVITKVIDSVIKWTYGAFEYASIYRGGSEFGNYMALYELIAIVVSEGWALTLTLMSLMWAFDLWALMEKREFQVKTEGSGGVPIDYIDAIKFFTLCMIVGFSSLVGGFSLGDSAYRLLFFFDVAGLYTKIEVDTNSDGTIDEDGTALSRDLLYLVITKLFAYAVFTSITLGGHMFGWMFMRFNETFECDFEAVDNATKQDILDLYNQITTVEKCYELLPQVKAKTDFNKNGVIDKCESAQMLKFLGNSEEYALKFSFNASLYGTQMECDNSFDPLYYSA